MLRGLLRVQAFLGAESYRDHHPESNQVPLPGGAAALQELLQDSIQATARVVQPLPAIVGVASWAWLLICTKQPKL